MSKEYLVEAIRDCRIIDGKKQYYVKWEDYDESQNTWEPMKNLKNVYYMIEEFERNRMNSDVSYIESSDCIQENERRDISDLFDDDENDPRIPKKILKVEKINNKLHSKVKFEIMNDGITPETKWVPNSILKKKSPEVLIKFYEDKIKFLK